MNQRVFFHCPGRCHARDLLEQIINFCAYNEVRPLINEPHLDQAVRNYFTALKGD